MVAKDVGSTERDRFRLLVDQSVDGILVVDRAGRVKLANASAARLLRRSPSDLVDYEVGIPAVANDPVEIVIAPQSEEPTVVELRANDIEWDDESALLVSLRDVTERQRQQERTDRLNTTLRTMLDIEALILREKSADELLKSACEILVTRLGYQAASVVTLSSDRDRKWVAESLVEEGRSYTGSVIRLDSTPPCCVEARDTPGGVVQWESSDATCGHCAASALCPNRPRIVTCIENDGTVFGYLILVQTTGSSHDQEELGLIARLSGDLGRALRSLEAQKELEDSEERFRKLFENSTDGIVIGDPQGRYLHANDAAVALFGYPREQLLAMKVSELIVPEGDPEPGQRYREFTTSGEDRGTFSFVRPDSSRRVIEYAAFQLEPERYVSFLRDVTDRVALESELRQAQKMEAVGRLAGGIAHDFNNLLTVIFSYADFVMAEMDEASDAHKDMQELHKAAKRARDLTGQLLAFSRKRTVAPEIIDPNEKVRDVHRMLERLLGEDISVSTKLDHAVGTIRMDPSALEQVMMNLAVNSRDAMPRGGRLTIETQRVSLSSDYGDGKGAYVPKGDYVVISVSDNGLGMDAETQRLVFEPFFTTKPAGHGTGLGLSTVYGIVKQAGGYVWLYSEPGAGTTFKIYLPALDATAGPSRERRVRSRRGGSETVLVVEDNQQVRALVVRTLGEAGYDVLVAEDGRAAVALCEQRSTSIDLLLTDVVMPHMSGRTLAERLARLHPGIKVAFMSGYTSNAIVQHGILEEGVALLHKPFSPKDLLVQVREVLDSDRWYAQDLLLHHPTVLIVANRSDEREALRQHLEASFQVLVAPDGSAALELVKQTVPDAIVCDYQLAGLSGRDLYDSVRALNPELRHVFIFTADADMGEAWDFARLRGRVVLAKPVEPVALREALLAIVSKNTPA